MADLEEEVETRRLLAALDKVRPYLSQDEADYAEREIMLGKHGCATAWDVTADRRGRASLGGYEGADELFAAMFAFVEHIEDVEKNGRLRKIYYSLPDDWCDPEEWRLRSV